MGALVDEITPCGRQLQHPQRVPCGGRVEDDVIVAFLDGFIRDEVGKCVERCDLDGAGAGKRKR